MNKTKFFSSLLVVALFATASVLTSCKDYDDDIKNLQAQIDQKAAIDRLTALETTLNQNIATAQANAERKAAELATAAQNAAIAKAGELANAAQSAAEAKAAELANAAQAAAEAKAKELADAAQAAAEAKAKELADAAKSGAIEEATTLAKNAKAEAIAAIQPAIDAAIAGLATNPSEELKAKVAGIAKAQIDKWVAESLKAEVLKFKDDIVDGAEVEPGQIDGFEAIVAELYKAVTSVELIASYTGDGFYMEDGYNYPIGGLYSGDIEDGDLSMDFVFGKQATNEPFGNKEIGDVNADADFTDADPIKEYSTSKDINTQTFILVRVNPVNATFTKDQVKFFDSMGNTLDELVEVGEPYAFEGLITRTRAAETQATGLWVVPVKVKENVDLNTFNAETISDWDEVVEACAEAKLPVEVYAALKFGNIFGSRINVPEGQEVRPIDIDGRRAPATNPFAAIRNIPTRVNQKLYAVAINNSEDEQAADRFVASTFDLGATYSPFVPAIGLNFNVMTNDEDITNVNYIHNRWCERGNNMRRDIIQSKDQPAAYTKLNPEQRWAFPWEVDEEWSWENVTLEDFFNFGIPTDKASVDPANTTNDEDDYRYNEDYFVAEVGTTIEIELPDYLKEKVEWWYVVYDHKLNAVESAPSEWEAWQSYESQVEGLNKMFAGVDNIKLTVKAKDAAGDVIGFRVFAVNYDGTLLDPDGKAFYVKCGDLPVVALDAAGEFTAIKQSDNGVHRLTIASEEVSVENGNNVGIVEVEQEFESLSLQGNNGKIELTPTEDEDDANFGKLAGNVTVYWTLLNEEGELATDWSEIKYIKMGVNGEDLADIVDGATLDLGTILEKERTDANKREIYRVNATVTKNMPTEVVDGIVWKNGYEFASVIYPKPVPYAAIRPSWNYFDDNEFLWNRSNNLPINFGAPSYKYNDRAQFVQRHIVDYIKSDLLDFQPWGANADYAHEFQLIGVPTGMSEYQIESGAPEAADFFAVAGETSYKKAGYTFLTLRPEVIGNKYGFWLNYTYKNISLTVDEEGNFNNDHNYTLNVWKKETEFKNIIDLLTWDGIKADGSTKLYLPWSAVKDGQTSQLFKTAATATAAAKDAIQGILSLLGKMTTTGGDSVLVQDASVFENIDGVQGQAGIPGVAKKQHVFNESNSTSQAGGYYRLYAFDNPETEDVDERWFNTFELTGDIATYIEPTQGATGQYIEVQKKGGANQPTVDKTGKLTIFGYDCFGKEHKWTVTVVLQFDK